MRFLKERFGATQVTCPGAILSRPDLLAYIGNGRLALDPVVEETQIEQVSVDLRLGRKFTTFRTGQQHIPSVRPMPSLWSSLDLWNHEEADRFTIRPGQFLLAQTHETVGIPPDLMGFVEGRSSFARVGVSIHVTAPKIDPGFRGRITLEMMNFGTYPVELHALEDRPAQLMLFRLTTPLATDDLYGTKESHRFQHQLDTIPRQSRKS
ncbi:MAG: dCTP deaminase [Myxococcales bacterium]|nr:dCTP deaminase [Myxococcales bacterium]